MASEPGQAAAIAGVVERPRLHQVLDSSLVRVCIAQGPSGAGKTTLVRSWALQQPGPAEIVWVSLGPGIGTRRAFWRHVAGIAARHGDLPRQTAARVEEQIDLAVDPVRIAATLLAYAGPVVIVLDAYEHLGALMPVIDADLAQLLYAVPGLRVVVTTRGRTDLVDLDPPGGVVRVITLSELALTTDEVGALIASQTGIRDQRLTASVTRATRGFPLTVRAVVLALAQLGRIPRLDSVEWNAVVGARLESLLQDPDVIGFVTDTSVPPYVDLELAGRLSGNGEARQLLEMLERNGFGRWIPYARGRPVFQYVETIRDSFRLRALGSPDRFRTSCVTTAQWLLDNEEVVDQALQFAVDGGDWALADRVFVSVVISNPDSYISDRFLTSLQQIPESVLPDHPMLAFGLGLALMANPAQRTQAPRIFRIAIESPVMPAYLEPAIDVFSLNAMRAIAQRLALSWRESCEATRVVVRQVDELAPELLAQFGEHVGTILRQLSYSLLQGGRVQEAIAAASRSVALCTRPAPRAYSLVYVAGIRAFAGEPLQADALVSAIDGDTWPAEMRHTSMNGLGLLAEAYACLDRLAFAEAVDILRDAREYMPLNEYWPFFATAGVLARHGLGQAQAEAERVTRELGAIAAPPGIGDNIGTEHLHAALALAQMACGDHRSAARLLAAHDPDSPYLAWARLTSLLVQGHDREALRRARALVDLPGHTIRTRVETQTIAAVAALGPAETALARSWLDAAAVAWENYGPRLHVALLDPRHRRVLTEFARQQSSPGLVRYLEVPVTGQVAALPVTDLTSRERVVLAALAEHDGTRAIAEALVVSPHTVKTQLQSVYRKLGVNSRQSALAVARELGLLGPSASGRAAELPDE
ncbi:MAG: LuxR C-terminal-related transcriptional regulator [Propionicimonas sp.]|nr:LuxR C-terminal-related transcriptional regulator [Propionicimonas sp.]